MTEDNGFDVPAGSTEEEDEFLDVPDGLISKSHAPDPRDSKPEHPCWHFSSPKYDPEGLWGDVFIRAGKEAFLIFFSHLYICRVENRAQMENVLKLPARIRAAEQREAAREAGQGDMWVEDFQSRGGSR